ncbi:MAG: hypothetical protein JKY08_05120 [Flavobacteriaceae bacterium]|nr:hypothetical protein [Flavobacteriaceae bacterium]
MKKTIIIIVLLLIGYSCKQKEKNMSNILKTEKEYMYGIDLMLDLSFELYIDDILVGSRFEKSRTIMVVDINEFLLESGEHKITLKLYPNSDSVDELLKDIMDYRVQLARWERQRESGLGRAKNFGILQKFSISKEFPIELEQNWSFNIDSLPYEIQGWKNSINLKNENKNNLQREVVAFYKKMGRFLIEGKSISFMEEKKHFYDEINTVEYYSKEEIKKDNILIKEDLLYWENTKVLPFENYKLVFYANGKLVSLIRVDEKYKNFSPLILEKELEDYEENEYQSFEFLLHRPTQNGKLQMIR